MRRIGSSDLARALMRQFYDAIAQEFNDGRLPIYSLISPAYAPGCLAESEGDSGFRRSVLLIYGSWNRDRDHIRVTTWRDRDGSTYLPEHSLGTELAGIEEREIHVNGRPISGVLRRSAMAWQLTASSGECHLLLSGHGPTGDLSLTSQADIDALIEAGRARAQRDFQ